MTIKIPLEFSSSGNNRTAQDVLAIQAAIAKTAKEAPGIENLAKALGTNAKEAKALAQRLELTAEQTEEAVKALRQLQAIGANTETTIETLASRLKLSADQVKLLERSMQTYGDSVRASAAQNSTLSDGVTELAFKFNNVVQAIQSLAAAAKPAYDFLIGSNEKLNAQLLSSQTNLASSTRIFEGGQEIKDPTAKIQASRTALEAALKQVEKDTQSLVGVTSAQVNELFQITLQNAASLNQQSKQFPEPIAAATSLTKGWAASLKVIGVPLNQASQEINSILQGTVDQNSQLARNLNITNEQVNKWKAQGTLVDELNKRLETFVSGNAIAARSIEGIGSNIVDIFEILGREAGKPLLEPVIAGLDAFYNLLKNNQDQILAFFTDIANQALQFGNQAVQALQPFLDAAGKLGQALISLAAEGLQNNVELAGQFAVAIATMTQALAPVVEIIAKMVQGFADFAKTDLGEVTLQAAAVTVALAQMPALLTAVGAALSANLIVPLTGFVTTTIPGLLAGLAGLPAVLAAASTAALPLAAALAPLAGAVALTFIVKGTQDMKNAQEDIDALSGATNTLADESLKYASKLKALQDIEKNGGKLTEEQNRQKRGYIKLSKDTGKAIDEQIAALKALQPANEEQRNAIQAQITLLEQRKALMSNQGGGLNIQGKELEELGNSFDQLKKKVENAQTQLNSQGNGDPTIFQQAAKDVIDLTQQQLQLGQITEAEAEKRLSAIQNNTKVEVGTQLKAKSEIVNIRKGQIDEEIAALQAGQSKIEADRIAGNISELEADRQLTDLKVQEIQKRIEQQKAIQATGTEDQKKAAITEEKKLQGELAKVQAESRKRQSELQVKAILEANEKVETAIKQSQTARIAATRESEIAALRQGGVDRERLERETQQKITQIQLESTNKELEAKKNTLAQIRQARAAGQIDQKTAAEQEKQLINQIGQLNLQRLDAEKAKLQELIAERIRALDVELQRAKLPLEAQASGLGNVNALLQQQSNLLTAQQGLETALSNLKLQRLNYALEDAKAAGDAAAITEAQQEVFKEQTAQLELQYKAKLAALDLSEKIKANELEIAKIQAQIAVLEAEAAIKKAEAEGKSQQEIEALKQQLDLKQKIAELSDKAISNQEEINKKTREQLAVEQKTATERLQREQQQIVKQQQEKQQQKLETEQRKAEAEQQKAETSSTAGNATDTSQRGQVKRSFNLFGEQVGQYDKAGQAFTDILRSSQSKDDQQIALLQQLAGGTLNNNEKAFLAMKAEDNGFTGISALAKQLENISQFDLETTIRKTQEAGGNVIEALQALTKGADDASSKLGGLPRLQARRDGGSVQAGLPYLVGEAGAEIIMPSQPGWVLTAQQTAALLGGVGSAGFSLPSVDGGFDPSLLQEVKSLNSSIERIAEQAAYPKTLVVQSDQPETSAARIWADLSRDRVRRSKL